MTTHEMETESKMEKLLSLKLLKLLTFAFFFFLKLKNGSAFAYMLNPIALRKAKIVYSFGLSECSRVKILIFH